MRYIICLAMLLLTTSVFANTESENLTGSFEQGSGYVSTGNVTTGNVKKFQKRKIPIVVHKKNTQEEKDLYTQVAERFGSDYGIDVKSVNLAGVSYAFARQETSLGTAGVGVSMNNMFSLKIGSCKTKCKYAPKWESKYGVYRGTKSFYKFYNKSGYRYYDDKADSVYDFMYLYYFSYKMSLSKDGIKRYLGYNNDTYRSNILKYIKIYNSKK